MNIRDEILGTRKKRIAEEGPALGTAVPGRREFPLVPFGRTPFIICEIKRKSPSKGNIATDLDAEKQAGLYWKDGVRSVSVLTEEDYFSGSLTDLMNVKRSFPELSLLRKDFLYNEEDIDISYRAGADAVLLIAALLTPEMLKRMYDRASGYGMECLVEVHTEEDIEKARPLRPGFTGINSRDLRTFQTDMLLPFTIADCIDWETELVFESGINSREEGVTVLEAGFSGVLVGEGVVRKPSLVGDLVEAVSDTRMPPRRFWSEIAGRKRKRKRPLIKICGITNVEDAETAAALGADVLGLVFADSPRRADFGLPLKLRQSETTRDILAVAVVTGGVGGLSEDMRGKITPLLSSGMIDAVQFHGDETADACFSCARPYYKAIRAGTKEDLYRAEEYRCPRVLLDAYAESQYGGSGRSIDDRLLDWNRNEKAYSRPLWLAGGLKPETVKGVIRRYAPELVDASSGLESCPGRKDGNKVKKFIREVEHAG